MRNSPVKTHLHLKPQLGLAIALIIGLSANASAQIAFEDVSGPAGFSASGSETWGAAWGDFDNDMDEDIFLACTAGSHNISNVLYLNNGNGKFTEVANAGGASGNIGAAIADHAGTSESVVAADYDLDGYLDLLVTNGNNMRPLTLSGPKNLFHNLGGTNGWIEFDLVGTTSNRDGIGSKVYITSGGVTQYREQNGSSTVYSGLSANCVYQLKQDGTTVMLKGGLDSDTDGEGLTDGAEVKDGDGLIDGQEAGAGGYGTNPLNPDQRWRRCQ